MNYDVIALACEQLDYRDKLRLAQLLIQTARKEEENLNPKSQVVDQKKNKPEVKQLVQDEIDSVSYVHERLLKLRPGKVKSLRNSIKVMFQYKGSITESEVDEIIKELKTRKLIKLNNNKVEYPQALVKA